MIYFDNAATSGFKIHAVTEAVNQAVKYLNSNPGRSGHSLALLGARRVEDCRLELSKFFGGRFDRTIFTKNCTEALNLAIFGTVKKGGHVITTVYEHNSVLRPLFRLKQLGYITLTIVKPSLTLSLASIIEKQITDKTYLIICTSASNVTGEVLPIKEIGLIAKKHSLLFIVDGAQGGGHIKLNLQKQNISALTLAGHKGLGGIMGSGALLFNENVDISPLIYGGTGSDTFNLSSPLSYPESLEAGTINLPAVCALKEGINYVKTNLNFISSTLIQYTEKIITALSQNPKVKVFSKPNPCGIVSFLIEGLSSEQVAFILDKEYDVAVRGAFHCSPLMHEYLSTEKEGLTRVSLSVHNTVREIDFFIKSIDKITKN